MLQNSSYQDEYKCKGENTAEQSQFEITQLKLAHINSIQLFEQENEELYNNIKQLKSKNMALTASLCQERYTNSQLKQELELLKSQKNSQLQAYQNSLSEANDKINQYRDLLNQLVQHKIDNFDQENHYQQYSEYENVLSILENSNCIQLLETEAETDEDTNNLCDSINNNSENDIMKTNLNQNDGSYLPCDYEIDKIYDQRISRHLVNFNSEINSQVAVVNNTFTDKDSVYSISDLVTDSSVKCKKSLESIKSPPITSSIYPLSSHLSDTESILNSTFISNNETIISTKSNKTLAEEFQQVDVVKKKDSKNIFAQFIDDYKNHIKTDQNIVYGILF